MGKVGNPRHPGLRGRHGNNRNPGSLPAADDFRPEGYAAGEMKHGPIALIEDDVPVIVVAPGDGLFEKTASNTQEVIARGGKVIFFSDAAGVKVYHWLIIIVEGVPELFIWAMVI